MRILTRYIAATFLRHLSLTLFALTGLVVLANLFGEIEVVLASLGSFLGFLERTGRSLPGIVEMLLPMVVLLAALFTFAGLSRNAELVAMKVAGCGPGHLLWPLLLVLIPVTVLAYLNQSYLFALLNPPTELPGGQGRAENVWRASAHALYYVGELEPRRSVIRDTRTFRTDASGSRMEEVARLGAGSRDEAGWRFSDVIIHRRDGGGWRMERDAVRRIPADAFPDVFRLGELPPRYLPFWELYQEVRRREADGRRVALHWLEWYHKPAALFALIVMALLGAALVQSSSRRGRLGLESTITVLSGILFWLISQIFLMLGKGEFLSPIVAAWTPGLLFFALGFVMFRRSF